MQRARLKFVSLNSKSPRCWYWFRTASTVHLLGSLLSARSLSKHQRHEWKIATPSQETTSALGFRVFFATCQFSLPLARWLFTDIFVPMARTELLKIRNVNKVSERWRMHKHEIMIIYELNYSPSNFKPLTCLHDFELRFVKLFGIVALTTALLNQSRLRMYSYAISWLFPRYILIAGFADTICDFGL